MADNRIHPSAIIGRDVELGSSNTIGPFVIIEDRVTIGCGNTVMAGAYICSGTEIGNENVVHMQAVIGHTPQDLAYKDEPTFTKIGNRNSIREFVTIHRGTKAGTATVIGDSNFLMAYCHIAHNCQVGNHVIMVNQASLAGYILVEDQAFLSSMTGLHQFSRVGRLAMVSALSVSNKDIPPYVTCGGRPAVALGVNFVGLRRAGFSPEIRQEINRAFKLIYRSGLNVSQAVEAIKRELFSAEVGHLIHFIEESKRGIIDGAKRISDESEETLRPRK